MKRPVDAGSVSVCRLLAPALAMVLVVGACASASSSPSPSALPQGTEPAAWTAEIHDLQPDGTRTLDSALKLMAMAFGPIPGVDAPQATGGTIMSATEATRVVLANMDKLTDDQRTAIEKYITPPSDTTQFEVPGNAPAPSAAQADNRLLAAGPGFVADAPPRVDMGQKRIEGAGADIVAIYQSAVEQYRNDLDLKVGGFSGPITVWLMATSSPITWSEYDFLPGSIYHCNIYLSYGAGTAEQRFHSLAHEVFHCYQAHFLWGAANPSQYIPLIPAWVWEGQAEYAALVETATTAGHEDAWPTYLTRPDIPLFERANDAVGFYAHLAESGAAFNEYVWSAMSQMFYNEDSAGRFEKSGAASDQFLDSWASSVARQAGFSTAWNTTGPQITGDQAPRTEVTIGTGDIEAVAADAYTNAVYDLVVSADVLHVEISGHGRLSDGVVDSVRLDDAYFCTNADGCENKCPDGSSPELPLEDLSPASLLGISGATDGTTGALSGISLDELCKKTPQACENGGPTSELSGDVARSDTAADATPCPSPTPTATPTATPEPPTAQGCGDECGESNGDPHLTTINAYSYDFMAAGEFVLLRSADGAIEVQVRQEPYDSNEGQVAINTALAIKADTHRIGITTDPAGGSLALTLDGAHVDPSQGLDVGGVTALQTDKGIEVHFSDGTVLWAAGQAGYGINVTVAPSATVKTSGKGLMGFVQQTGLLALPALPDGTIPAVTVDNYNQVLYGQFADAWRITQDESLFDYAAGQSTDTFTDRTFPDPNGVLTIDDLTPEQRAAGEAACASVGMEPLHSQCVFDVGLTGADQFSSIYDISADIVSTGSLVPAGERERVVNLYLNESGPTDLDVYAWSNAGTALVATVPYGTTSAFFDPGSMNDDFGEVVTRISMQRHGETPNDWNLNLVDLEFKDVAGSTRTTVVGPGDTSQATWVGGRPASTHTNDEVAPGQLSELRAAPDGQALLFVDASALEQTGQSQAKFVVSSDDTCLAVIDFPTVTWVAGPFQSDQPAPLDPGHHEIVFHSVPQGALPDNPCSASAMIPAIALDAAAGQRFLVVLYADTDGGAIKTLLVPFGS